MSGDFRKKASGIFITVFIGLIVISFVITGYDGQKGGSSSTIGSVGDYKIDYSEFQNAYERQISLFKQLYGGKELTTKEIQQMQVRENIVKQLVQQKLVLVFADKIGISPSEEEVKDSIYNFSQGEQKIFQTKGVFNVDLYKKMLANARITPAQFEKQNEINIKNQAILQLISKVPVSKSFGEELDDLRKKKIKTDIFVINKKQLENFVEVSENEVADYLKKNLEQLKANFELVKNQLSKPEQIKVKHILIYDDEKDGEKLIQELSKNLTVKNFAKMAEKYNRSQEEKNNGGELGWIQKGRGVPEFDMAFSLKPGTVSPVIKTKYGSHFLFVQDKKAAYVPDFEKLKTEMAKEMIQSQKPFEVEKLVQTISKEIGELLKADKIAQAEELAKKYKLNPQRGLIINPLDGARGVNLPSDSLLKIFSDNLEKPKTFVFANPTGVILIRASGQNIKDEPEKKDNLQNIYGELAQIFAVDITNSVKDEVKVSLHKFFE